MNARIKRLGEFASNIKDIFTKKSQDDIMVERRIQPSDCNFITNRNDEQNFKIEKENFKR